MKPPPSVGLLLWKESGEGVMDREKAIRQWDKARKYIADGGSASWPRDMFESYLDKIEELEQQIIEAQKYSTDAHAAKVRNITPLQALREQAEYYEKMMSELEQQLEDEKNHSNFLERLCSARHGEGWENLTIAQAERIQQEVERLRTALERYGRHLDDCGKATYNNEWDNAKLPCTCGLEQGKGEERGGRIIL